MYIVLFTTRGASSWPRSTLVEKVQAGRRFFTFSVVISVSWLWRMPLTLLPARVHWPSSGSSVAVARGVPAAAAAGGAGSRERLATSSRVQAATASSTVAHNRLWERRSNDILTVTGLVG